MPATLRGRETSPAFPTRRSPDRVPLWFWGLQTFSQDPPAGRVFGGGRGHLPDSGPAPAPHVTPPVREACNSRRALLSPCPGPGTRGSEGRRRGALCPQRPITGDQDGTSREEFLTRLSWSRPRAQHGLLLGEVTVTNEENQVHVPEKVQNGNPGQHCLRRSAHASPLPQCRPGPSWAPLQPPATSGAFERLVGPPRAGLMQTHLTKQTRTEAGGLRANPQP